MVLDKVDARDVRPSVRVHNDEVIVAAILRVLAQPVREAAALVLAEKAVHPGHLVVGGVQVKLHYIRLYCSSIPRTILRVRNET